LMLKGSLLTVKSVLPNQGPFFLQFAIANDDSFTSNT
jgi:hypothetical protein